MRFEVVPGMLDLLRAGLSRVYRQLISISISLPSSPLSNSTERRTVSGTFTKIALPSRSRSRPFFDASWSASVVQAPRGLLAAELGLALDVLDVVAHGDVIADRSSYAVAAAWSEPVGSFAPSGSTSRQRASAKQKRP